MKMRIARLSIRNFMGVKEVDIKPGDMTTITGKNGQGKSSVLKGIQAIFKGAPFSVVHQGTERAELIAEMEDIRVTRVITHKTSSVTVKDERGFTRPSPQGFLDGLLGNFALNPMDFLLAEKKGKILLKAMDVTVTKEEVEAAASTGEAKEALPLPASGPALEMYADAHKYFYSKRTDVNRRLKQKQAAAAEVLKKLPEGYKPVEGIDGMASANRQLISEIEAEISGLEADKKASTKAAETRGKLTDRIAKNERIAADARKELEKMKDPDIETLRQKVEQLRALLDEAERNLEAAVRRAREIADMKIIIGDMARTVASYKETLAALPGVFDDTLLEASKGNLAELNSEAAAIEEEKSRQRIWNEHVILREEAEDAEKLSGKLSALVERFGNDLPAQALRDAKLPIEGLAIDGDNVTVGGVPLEQLATSEHIRVTLSIARAMSKELPLICIDGVERLDEERFAEFTRQAHNDGFQYFVSRVGVPREGEIEIREGKVATA
jgi:DNA repair exonuclease SbcCD ATPase subunit